MIVTQNDFHSNPFSGFRHTSSRKSPLLRVILLCQELHPFIIIIQMAPSICDAFDNTHVQYINDTLHINRSVFKPQFIHYTKYAKYAFLLLSSIYDIDSTVKVSSQICISFLKSLRYSRKTNQLLNIHNIRSGTRDISNQNRLLSISNLKSSGLSQI